MTTALDPRTARIIPWIVASAFFMQTLDGTILNTALPAMAASLGESPLRMQAAGISYLPTVRYVSYKKISSNSCLTSRLDVI